MKNLQRLFSTTLVLFLTVTLFSCNKEDEEAIFTEAGLVGVWTIESSELKINGQSLTDGDTGFFSYPKNSVIEFLSSKRYNISDESLAVIYEEGTWAFDGASTVTLTDSNDEVTIYTIQSMNGKSARLYSLVEESLLGVSLKSEQTLNLKK